MALTRDLKATVLARARDDPKFRDGLFEGGVESMLAGEVAAGNTILRDYIEATGGFERLGAEVGLSPRRLVRMFAPAGNPTARNLFTVIGHMQRRAGLTLRVSVRSR